MSEYKIGIISCYFGNLPSSFEAWLRSCEYNQTINWILVTDQSINHIPKNVQHIHMELSSMCFLVNEKLGSNMTEISPHKLCDFKPLYGYLFSELLSDYDVWGYCDLDMVFGDIRKFITDEILSNNDKFYTLGHLSLYKNNKEILSTVYLPGSKITMDDVLNNRNTLGFDEYKGIYEIYKNNDLKIYEKFDFADITQKYDRFRLSTSYLNLKNYDHQVFYWENGRVFRAYKLEDKILHEEFCYIHFQKRNLDYPNFDVYNSESFFITNRGFIRRDSGSTISIKDIDDHNNYKGLSYETYEGIKVRLNINWRRFKNLFTKLLRNG